MASHDRAQPGQPLRIPASDYNAMLEAGHRADRPHLGLPEAGGYPVTLCKVKNNTSQDLDRFRVLGLGSPLVEPDDDLPEFLRQATFVGALPTAGTHEGKWAVLLEPLPSGAIGSAAIAGIVPAFLFVEGVGGLAFGWAEITTGQTYLANTMGGTARVIWCASAELPEDKPAGADDGGEIRRCRIRIGSDEPHVRFFKPTSGPFGFGYYVGNIVRKNPLTGAEVVEFTNHRGIPS